MQGPRAGGNEIELVQSSVRSVANSACLAVLPPRVRPLLIIRLPRSNQSPLGSAVAREISVLEAGQIRI